jgi:hypothetical protein
VPGLIIVAMANVALTFNRNGFTNGEPKRVPKREVSLFVTEEQKQARYILLLPTPLGSYSSKATPISVSVAGRAPRRRLSFFGALRSLFRRR